MTRPTPANVEILPESAFVVPPLAVEPLRTILRNVNALWLYHSPALATIAFADDYSAGTTSATYIIPIYPSQDGLDYTVELALTPSINVTRTYSYSTTGQIGGAWTALGSVLGGTGASGIVTDGPYTLPASARAVRVQLSGATPFFPQSMLIYPSPSTVPAGRQASGFVAYDDGLLEGPAGAPLHQEFLDRARVSAISVWHDRLQNCGSLACEIFERVNHKAQAGANVLQQRGLRMRLPGYAGATRFRVAVLAEHSSGGTVARAVTVKIGTASVQLDASGQVESDFVTATPTGAGLDTFVDLEFHLTNGGLGTSYLHSLMVWPDA